MRRKERGRQLLRILKLIKLFEHSRYGLTINELCREMTVTRRTLYGDLVFTHVAKMTPSKDYRRHAATVSALSRACLEHRKVEVNYRAGDDLTKTYAFSPYCIAYYGGELYTIGWSDLRQTVRTLRVD